MSARSSRRRPPLRVILAPAYDLTKLIACPTCHAKVTQTCRTRNGRRTTPHSTRLAPRLCPCGELLDAQRRLCDWCRDEAIRICKRDHLRRVREKREDAA